MKITVEINDTTLHNAIEQQLSATVAEVTNQLIAVKVNEIVDKKLGRLTEERVEECLERAALKLVQNQFGSSDWQRATQIKSLISTAAERIVKDSIKRS